MLPDQRRTGDRRVSLSPPAVAECVRRLEDLGVITGDQARSQGWTRPQQP